MKKIYFVLCTVIFYSSINAQQLAPSVIWQKCLGGSGEEKANTIIRTVDNGYLIAGSSKSNDGDVTGHHGSLDSTDAWVVRLSENGNLIWQKSYGGSGNDELVQLIATKDGGYVGIGTTSSNDGDVSRNHGSIDVWVIKINRYGNLLWQKCFGGSMREYPKSIKATNDGGYLIIGTTSSNDGDISKNQATGEDVLLLKINAQGSLEWQKCYGGSMPDFGYDVVQMSGSGYLLGIASNSRNGDFATLGGSGPVSCLLQIDEGGNVLNVTQDNQRSSIYSIKPLNTDDYIFIRNSTPCYPVSSSFGTNVVKYKLGSYAPSSIVSYYNCGSFGEDPFGYSTQGPDNIIQIASDHYIVSMSTDNSISNDQTKGKIDALLSKFDLSGKTLWQKRYGGSNDDYFYSLTKENEFTYVACGYTTSDDGDVSGNHGKSDFWVVKVGQTNLIKGTVFADYNSNNIKDGGEPFVDNIIVESRKNNIKAASSTYNGIFSNSVDTGGYSTMVLTSTPYYSIAPVSKNSIFTQYNIQDSMSFALRPIPGKRDYQISLYPTSALRPGFKATYSFQYSNIGTDTLLSKDIIFIKDGRLQFLFSDHVPYEINGDTIKWNISSLLPRQSANIELELEAAPPPILNISDTVINKAFIDSTEDLLPTNNLSIVKQAVSGSYDPNDKQESRSGIFSTREIMDNSYLIYTIRFQNTGNDTAFNVVVKDTLDSNIDWNSLEMIGASHHYKMDILEENKITWNFKNILLADSVHNEPESHGYITYRIKPQSDIPLGASIKNSASIYFDFNPPIQTNIHITTIKEPSLPQPELLNLQPEYCQTISTYIQAKINNIPVDDVTVSVFIDNITVQTIGNVFSFKISDLSIGNHTIKVVFKNSQDEQFTTHNFIVIKPSVPVVKISANITSVSNTSNPLIIKATNISGGGILPLYSFSKDRLFTTYLQTESSNNTFNGPSSILDIGSNWIYVRMKTSETCYTSETAIDSINILRTKYNGLVDIDYPDDIINIYPNPFKYEINIGGLHTDKEYTIVMQSSSGQEVYRRSFKNSNSFSIKNNFQSGKYFVSIYDSKKNKLIGTISLVKL